MAEVRAVKGDSLGWVPENQAARMVAHMYVRTAIRGQISMLVGNMDAGYNLGVIITLVVVNIVSPIRKAMTMQAAELPRLGSAKSQSGASSYLICNGYNDDDYEADDSEWEPACWDDDYERAEDETAEGLGVGDIEFSDCDSEY